MTLSYDGNFITTGHGGAFIVAANNVPGLGRVAVAVSDSGTYFQVWNVGSRTIATSAFGTFTTAFSLKAMDFISTSKLALAVTGTTTDIYTLDINSSAKVNLGTLYSSVQLISQVVGINSAGKAIVIPPTTRTGELGLVDSTANTVTLMTPSWLNNYIIHSACALDSNNGFILCASYPDSDDLTIFNVSLSLGLNSNQVIKSKNIPASTILSSRTSNGYLYLTTSNNFVVIDMLTSSIIQIVPMSKGSKFISSLNNASLYVVEEPTISELDVYLTPIVSKAYFNTSYTVIGGVDVNITGSKLWFWSNGTAIMDVCSVSGLRSVSNQTIQLTDGSGVPSEMIFMDDTAPPLSLIFSTTVPSSGRTVLLPTGKNIIEFAYYGNGLNEKFKVDRGNT